VCGLQGEPSKRDALELEFRGEGAWEEKEVVRDIGGKGEAQACSIFDRSSSRREGLVSARSLKVRGEFWQVVVS